jgi:protein-S-isoprenylcysteine O-methyltransferase Ste14
VAYDVGVDIVTNPQTVLTGIFGHNSPLCLFLKGSMNKDRLKSGMDGEDDSSQRLGNMSLTEIGERLFYWRDYTAIPATLFLLLFANPSARTATVGTLLIVIGAAARVYTVAFMGDRSRDDVGSDHLVTTGPFALIRNPLYLANLVITLGVIFYAGIIWLGAPLLLYFMFQYHCIAKYEENTLLAKFGDEYQRYMDRVPPWLPLKSPIADDFPVPPSLSAAFVAEKKAIAAVAIILFLLMLASH